MPQLRAHLARKHTQLAEQQIEVSARLTNEMVTRVENGEELPLRDLAGAVRNFDVGSGIHTDKSRELRGEPTYIVTEHRDVAQILRELQGEGVNVESMLPGSQAAIESTAEELPNEAA